MDHVLGVVNNIMPDTRMTYQWHLHELISVFLDNEIRTSVCKDYVLYLNERAKSHKLVLLKFTMFFRKPRHSNQIKSNHFKSLLLSHHHSTSALVSEILMSVLQTMQKNNRQFTYGQTVQKKQQTIYLWTDSAKKTTTNNLPMDRQCKKNNNKQFTYGQTVQKKQQTIYIWTDSAKKQQTIYIWTDSAKKKQQLQFTYGQTVQKNNSNLHMDSTYLQTVQKTMCKIHIHILSTLSVL